MHYFVYNPQINVPILSKMYSLWLSIILLFSADISFATKFGISIGTSLPLTLDLMTVVVAVLRLKNCKEMQALQQKVFRNGVKMMS